MNAFLVSLIRLIHLFIVCFIIFGWVFGSASILWAHLILVPLVILHWKTNNNTCFLTNLENRLKAKDEKAEGEFVKSILAKFVDPLPSDRALSHAIYGVMSIAWGISSIRVLL